MLDVRVAIASLCYMISALRIATVKVMSSKGDSTAMFMAKADIMVEPKGSLSI